MPTFEVPGFIFNDLRFFEPRIREVGLKNLASPGLWQEPAIIVGTVTVAGMSLAPRLTKAVPATIIGLAAGLLAYLGLGIFRPELLQLEHNKLVIGPIGSGAGAIFTGLSDHWPAVANLSTADVWSMLGPALTLSVLLSIRMFDWRSFRLLRQKSTVLDFVVIATVVIVALGWNLIAAAGAGVALSIVLFIREQIRGSVVRRRIAGGRISSTQHRLPEEQAVLEREGALITVCELQGSLFFGTTDQLLTELEPDLRSCRYLILDLRRVQAVDYTAAHMLERIEATLVERRGFLIFARLPARRDLREYFLQSNVMKAGRGVRRFETLDDALQWAEDCILAEQLTTRSGGERPLALAEFDLLRDLKADQSLAALATGVVERSFAAGQRVFKAGDPGDELYLVRRGIVRVALPLKDGSYHNLASFGRGNHFGAMAPEHKAAGN